MSPNRPDPLAVVTALAPRHEPVANDAADAALAQLWLDIDALPPPTFRARHRRAVAAGAVFAVAAAGVGTAAAVGVPLPAAVQQSWRHLFSDPSRGPGSYALADPHTAKRVFAAPGPNGTRFEAWTATNTHRGLCVSTVFTSATATTPPTELLEGVGQCAHSDAPHGLFAEGAGSSLGPANDRVHFAWDAGAATRAELQVSNGRVYPVDIQNGWLGGWYDADQVPLGASAVIVAYAADGSVLGRLAAQDQAGCPTRNPC